MQDQSTTSTFKEVTVTSLPGEYDAPDFTQSYQDYVSRTEVAESDAVMTYLSILVAAVGIVLVVIGGLFVIFGPSTVMVSYRGPTFWQFFQLYPGPIATFGMLVCSFAGWLQTQAKPSVSSPEQYLEKNWYFRMADGSDCKLALHFVHLQENTFRIEAASEAGHAPRSSGT